MSTAFIPSIRDLIGRLTIPEAQSISAEAMRLKTTAQITTLMDQYLEARAPHLMPLLIA